MPEGRNRGAESADVRLARHATLRALFAALTCGATLLVGCAYYNTFYNAKKAYSDALDLGKNVDPRSQPTGQQRSKYQVCIQKCQGVLDEYPDSGLIDDALFYMGRSYFGLKDYRKAIHGFDNLLANFPKSEFVEEAVYLKSVAHLEVGEQQPSMDLLGQLSRDYPNSRFGVEALYRLGQIHAREKRYDQATDYYAQYLKNYPKHAARTQVQLELGQLYIDQERFADAEPVLSGIDRKKATGEQQFTADFMRVQALRGLARAKEAADLLANLEKDADFYKKRGETLVLQGELRLDQGQADQGISILEAAATEFKGKPFESEARYAIAEHLLKTHGPDEKRVADQLQTAIDDKGGGDFGKQVQALQRQLARYSQLKEQLAKADSASAPRAAFQLAELLLVELEQPERALECYRKLLQEHPDSPLAPRSAYAIGYIESELVARPDSAQVMYTLLREKYPQSPQALALDGAVFLDPRPRPKPKAGDSEAGAGRPGAPGAGAASGEVEAQPGAGAGSGATPGAGDETARRHGHEGHDKAWLTDRDIPPAEQSWRALRLGGPGSAKPQRRP